MTIDLSDLEVGDSVSVVYSINFIPSKLRGEFLEVIAISRGNKNVVRNVFVSDPHQDRSYRVPSRLVDRVRKKEG